jgi:shikimate kinase
MFSNTVLGEMLREIKYGSGFTISPLYSPLTYVSLLLADFSIFPSPKTKKELISSFGPVFGDEGVWKGNEQVLPALISELRFITNELIASQYYSAAVYLLGMLNMDLPEFIQTVAPKSEHIYNKMQRIFYGTEKIVSSTVPKFVCLVGFKCSGKSSVLGELNKQGLQILEIYKGLESLKLRHPDKFLDLPPRENWNDEPLRLVLEYGNNLSNSGTVVVGSLLRQAEIKLLAEYGAVYIVYLDCPNQLRHERARQRGRKIEKFASNDWLVELDAHREGLWPEYEQNDLGSLINLSHATVVNNGSSAVSEVCSQILGFIPKTRGG